MERSKCTESRIALAIKETESGTRVEEICRKMGITKPYSITNPPLLSNRQEM